jgi:hypothetical protein
MIIEASHLTHTASGVRLESVVTLRGKSTVAYFEVDEAYGEYLTADRADPFLVAFFFYALTLGEDLEIRGRVTESLYYQITSTLLDFLVSIYPEKSLKPIRIIAETTPAPVQSRGAVGTGVSCGIDSLATIFRHQQHSCPSMALTHLCFFDTGSHGRPGEEKMEVLFRERRRLAYAFGEEAGLPVVEVRSNLSELVPLAFGLTHTYLNAAAALALQPLFSTYYYASGASVDSFLASNADPAYFDLYLLPLLSTPALRFYVGEENIGRFEKTRIVAAGTLSRRFLNVCNDEPENCGRCNKCIRTLLALDALGVVGEFGAVFDLESYRQLRDSHLVYHYKHYLKNNPSHLDLHPHLNGLLKFRHRFLGTLLYLRGKAGARLRKLAGIQRG